MLPSLPLTLVVLTAVALFMVVELQLSIANERWLRARGAVEPADDVYPIMRVVYPLAFVAMGIEALAHAGVPVALVATGILLLGLSKALKLWAVSSLGRLWSFRVLVLPEQPLVTRGPYRLMRHPNYLAVMGELGSVALTLAAPLSGTVTLAVFAWILWRRIRVEERALGRRGGSGMATGR
jgi:methyltransferase